VRLSAERALLGSLLVDPDATERVRAVLAPEDFAGARGRAVYGAICALYDRGDPVDFVLVGCELERRGELGSVVQTHELVDLCLHCPTSLHADAYAWRVKEAAERRRTPPPEPPADEPSASLAERLGLGRKAV